MFCGRYCEVEDTLAHCMQGRLAVITSHPGLGASTFLAQGIAPAMEAEGFIVVCFNNWSGRFIAPELKEAIAEAVRNQADESFFPQPETVAEMLSRIRTQTGRFVAVLLDQFEDYLRCHVGTHLSDAFDAELSHAIAEHESAFVISLHEHALQDFRRLEQYVPNLLGSHVKLGPFSRAAAEELVAVTGEERGVRFDPAVIQALVTAPVLAFEKGVHPFYLMAGVDRLLDVAQEKKGTAAGMSMLQVYGGADRLILESLDPVLNKLNPTHTELFFRWFPLLLSDKDQRLAVTPEALRQYSGKWNRYAQSLMPLLLESGILRSLELRETQRYEIARDSYTPIIRDWWQRREAFLVARRRAKFRVRSISIAVGSIVTLYALWLILTLRST